MPPRGMSSSLSPPTPPFVRTRKALPYCKRLMSMRTKRHDGPSSPQTAQTPSPPPPVLVPTRPPTLEQLAGIVYEGDDDENHDHARRKSDAASSIAAVAAAEREIKMTARTTTRKKERGEGQQYERHRSLDLLGTMLNQDEGPRGELQDSPPTPDPPGKDDDEAAAAHDMSSSKSKQRSKSYDGPELLISPMDDGEPSTGVEEPQRLEVEFKREWRKPQHEQRRGQPQSSLRPHQLGPRAEVEVRGQSPLPEYGAVWAVPRPVKTEFKKTAHRRATPPRRMVYKPTGDKAEQGKKLRERQGYRRCRSDDMVQVLKGGNSAVESLMESSSPADYPMTVPATVSVDRPSTSHARKGKHWKDRQGKSIDMLDAALPSPDGSPLPVGLDDSERSSGSHHQRHPAVALLVTPDGDGHLMAALEGLELKPSRKKRHPSERGKEQRQKQPQSYGRSKSNDVVQMFATTSGPSPADVDGVEVDAMDGVEVDAMDGIEVDDFNSDKHAQKALPKSRPKANRKEASCRRSKSDGLAQALSAAAGPAPVCVDEHTQKAQQQLPQQQLQQQQPYGRSKSSDVVKFFSTAPGPAAEVGAAHPDDHARRPKETMRRRFKHSEMIEIDLFSTSADSLRTDSPMPGDLKLAASMPTSMPAPDCADYREDDRVPTGDLDTFIKAMGFIRAMDVSDGSDKRREGGRCRRLSPHPVRGFTDPSLAKKKTPRNGRSADGNDVSKKNKSSRKHASRQSSRSKNSSHSSNKSSLESSSSSSDGSTVSTAEPSSPASFPKTASPYTEGHTNGKISDDDDSPSIATVDADEEDSGPDALAATVNTVHHSLNDKSHTAEELRILIEMMQVEFQRLRSAKAGAEARAQTLETDLASLREQRDADAVRLGDEAERWKRAAHEEKLRCDSLREARRDEVDRLRDENVTLNVEWGRAMKGKNEMKDRVEELERENRRLKKMLMKKKPQSGSRRDRRSKEKYAKEDGSRASSRESSRDCAMDLRETRSHDGGSTASSLSGFTAPTAESSTVRHRYRTPEPPSPGSGPPPSKHRPQDLQPPLGHHPPQSVHVRRHRDDSAGNRRRPPSKYSVPQAPSSWHGGKVKRPYLRGVPIQISPPLTSSGGNDMAKKNSVPQEI